jgi:hypothetical protein
MKIKVVTLHLPGTAPHILTADERAALGLHGPGSSLAIKRTHPLLGQLLGTSISIEVVASAPGTYLIVGPENAADYGFAVNESAAADFQRLTGVELDEPLVGPLLVIEAWLPAY